MSLDPSTFETVVPSRYITFTLPLHHHILRVAVLDSPAAADAAQSVAAMWVPLGRESDWIFSTFTGQLQLLFSAVSTQLISRLILVGDAPSCSRPTSFKSTQCPSILNPIQQDLTPLLLALFPKSAFRDNNPIPEIPFLIYEDEVVKSSILDICEGPCVGEMLVENVELENDGVKEFRRRLRFKRMPNLVQTQMRIHPLNESIFEDLDNVEFELEKKMLVHPYLTPMVAGLSVISSFLEGRMRDGLRPKALCLGVGGGALLGFLSVQMNFEVVGVEEDEVVLKVAKKYFALESNERVDLCVGDAIKFVQNLAENINGQNRFDVVMVDLDSSDPTMGCAPPVDFISKAVLLAVGAALCEEGVLIVNTILSDVSFYERIISQFQEVFEELYQIDVGNGENFVLIATKCNIGNAWDAGEGTFLNQLKLVISRTYIDSIRKISKNDGASVCKLP